MSPRRRTATPAAPPLRSLHLVTRSGDYGETTQVALLVQALHDAGHPCAVVAHQASDLPARLEGGGVPVHLVRPARRPASAVRTVTRLSRTLGPHVIHAHDRGAVLLAVASGLIGRRPALVGVRHRVDRGRPSLSNQLCDRVIATTEAARSIAVSGGLPAHHVHVVPAAVDERRHRPGDREAGRASVGVGPDETLVVAAGGFDTARGHGVLLEAFALLQAPHPKLRLAIAGAGPIRTALDIRSHELGVRDRTTLLGWRTPRPQLFAAADIVVEPSLRETLGLNLVDAMLAGQAPIVATDDPASRELIGPSASEPAVGLLAPVGDARSLAGVIDEALRLRGSEDGAAMIRAARRRALAHHALAPFLEGTLAACRDAAGHRSGPGNGRAPSTAPPPADATGDSDTEPGPAPEAGTRPRGTGFIEVDPDAAPTSRPLAPGERG